LVLTVGILNRNNAYGVTLEDALTTAYHNSPALEASRSQLRAIDERMAQAVSGWRPTLTGEASYQERHQDSGVGGANSPINPDVQFNPFRVGMSLEQPIYRGGQTVAEMRQAKSEIREGRANLRSTEQDVLLNTVTAFFDVRQDQVVLKLNQNNVQVLRQQMSAAEDRFEVGEVTRTDVAQAEAALSSAIANLTLAKAQLISSRARYQRHVGILPGTLDPTEGLPVLPANADDALAIALQRNPFLVAARHGEEASHHFVRRAVGNMLPSVTLDGEFSRTKEPSQFREYMRRREVIARLSIPLYQAGGASSRVREARQLHNQRRIDTLRTDREVRKRLKDAWAQYVSLKSTVTSRKEQVRANTIALEGVRQEALVGTRTTLDVLEEEQRLLNSRVTLENANRDEYVLAYQILSLMGDLMPENLGLSVAGYDPAENYRKVRYKMIGVGRSAAADPLPTADTTSVSIPKDQELQVEWSPVESDRTPASDVVENVSVSSDPHQYLVQIAAYRSVRMADRGWTILAEQYADLLGGRTPDVIGASIVDRGSYYRLRVGPSTDIGDARRLCSALKSQGQNCLIVGR
jgi:outer membrane protein